MTIGKLLEEKVFGLTNHRGKASLLGEADETELLNVIGLEIADMNAHAGTRFAIEASTLAPLRPDGSPLFTPVRTCAAWFYRGPAWACGALIEIFSPMPPIRGGQPQGSRLR